MSSSATSSRPTNRRNVYGVPSKCWCGSSLKTYASSTKDNPCRRFYRCVISKQWETEDHLFKWEDEAILDEVRMVDAKRLDLVHDVQTLSKALQEQLAVQESSIRELKQEMARRNNSLFQGNQGEKEDGNTGKTSTASPPPHHYPLKNIAVAFAVLGAASWLCWKFN